MRELVAGGALSQGLGTSLESKLSAALASIDQALLVDENNTAWHVGKYWQGYPTNPRSIGIDGRSTAGSGFQPFLRCSAITLV